MHWKKNNKKRLTNSIIGFMDHGRKADVQNVPLQPTMPVL